jgi:hypothetical protein
VITVKTHNKIYFLTSYVEYLLERGIRSEEYYLGDASRFIRFLLANSTEEDVRRFIEESAVSGTYRQRLEKTLRRFFTFCSEHLAIECPQKAKKPDTRQLG